MEENMWHGEKTYFSRKKNGDLKNSLILAWANWMKFQ